MGLADLCVTRGIKIWPYPLTVFERRANWRADSPRPTRARVMAFGDCLATDRYYMLAAQYGAGTNEQAARQRRRMALALIDLGLLGVVRVASWTRRRMRGMRSRPPLGRVERRLKRLRPWHG